MRSNFKLLKFLIVIFLLTAHKAYSKTEVPRTIITFYNSIQEPKLHLSLTHSMAEMPLNHLGLKLEYYDIAKEEYPDLSNRDDVRGILSWLEEGTILIDPDKYLQWIIDNIKDGKKFVMMGESTIHEGKDLLKPNPKLINQLLELMGLRHEQNWIDLTYDVKYIHKSPLTEFERKYTGFAKPYQQLQIINSDFSSHLTVRKGVGSENNAHLIVTGPTGGYVANGYAHYQHFSGKNIHVKQWYINPFDFFRTVFATDDLPKADTTTLAGRRLYYSHIDGDGWNNVTYLEEYEKDPPLSARVVLDKVLKVYSDLPVTVGVIAADIDKEWAAEEDSADIAVEILALPHIEVGSHTYSHPFFWERFEKNKHVEVKLPFDKKKKGKKSISKLKQLKSKILPGDEDTKPEYEHGYNSKSKSRGYTQKPFILKNEISGSVNFIERFSPPGKKVKVMQWSGNTSPFEEALKETRISGLLNINGGDSRFDQEYHSFTWVSPLGRQNGKEQQIYASNSNENTYTDLWTGRYHGFKYLIKTFENTESPYRLKPLNVYYHMYSGEREAALNALINNLEYVRSQNVIPVDTSHFIKIVEGFYKSKIYKISKDKWQIENHDELQTIRFDKASTKTVDYKNSVGVIGQRHLQGSLYVFLDKEVKSPIIALGKLKHFYAPVISYSAYLLESRWDVWQLKRTNNDFSFKTRGFGIGSMTWQVPRSGKYSISFKNKKIHLIAKKDNLLHFSINEDAITDVISVKVTYEGQ